MNKELINKFLTEKMGECWHEWEPKRDNVRNYDFFTWEGFGKLWEWAGEQEWFPYFINGEFFGYYGGVSFNFARNFIDPRVAIIAIAKYLGYNE